MSTVPDTLLTISDGTTLLPLYSTRGITQTFETTDGSMFQARTVNGELVDLSVSRFRKLRSKISGDDQRPPARDNVWPGRTVTVGCAYLLSYPTIGGSPSRTVVTGSSFTEGDFTFYRPTITFMIGKMTGSFDEWRAGYSWSIEMEEV